MVWNAIAIYNKYYHDGKQGVRWAGHVARKEDKRRLVFWADSLWERNSFEDVILGWRKRLPDLESSCEYTE
jgi:hypothetical protein